MEAITKIARKFGNFNPTFTAKDAKGRKEGREKSWVNLICETFSSVAASLLASLR